MDEFIWRALIGGIIVAIVSAPLGCLMVWQRMAFFGAALSHGALLGIALGLFLGVNLHLAILCISVLISLLLLWLQKNPTLSNDTILGILAHGALALGLLAIGLMPQLRIDLLAYLFGDLLTISWSDIGWIGAGSLIIVIMLIRFWQPLLATIVHPDLAKVEGHQHQRLHLIFLLLLSLVVAISMQVIGILLIVSLLIIPVTAARPFAKSPEQMLVTGILFGIVSVVMGIAMSVYFDTSAGPSIVVSSCLIFLLTFIGSKAMQH